MEELGWAMAMGRWQRLRGLAFVDRRRVRSGLLIPRCRSVHTFGMRFPLDVFFLDRRGRVIDVRRSVPPCRIVSVGQAMAVLELPAGEGERLEVGSLIRTCFPSTKTSRR